MYGPWGSFPLDIWRIILSYLDFTTLYTFTKVHPRFAQPARFAYTSKRKRRPDFAQISVPKIEICISNTIIAFDIRGSTLYLVQNFSGASIWTKESRISSWSLLGSKISSLEQLNKVLHKAGCVEFAGISVSKGGVLVVSSCRTDTLAAVDIETSNLLWTANVPSPWCVSCDASREHFLVSSLWHAIFQFDQRGHMISSISMDELNPSSIAMVPSTSELLISDRCMRTLQIVNTSGKLIRRISATDPSGVDVDEDNRLWVCSTTLRTIEVLSLSGEILHSFHCGSLEDPKQVRLANDGTVVVMDPSSLYIF